MRIRAKPLGIFALVLLVVAVMGILTLMSAQREGSPTAQRESPATERAAELAEQLLAQWVAEYGERDLYTKTPIPLRFSRAFSKHFTKALGKVEINFQTARVTVSVSGLDPLPDGSRYEVWLVENQPGLPTSTAINQGKDRDRILNLGTLPPTASLVTSVDAQVLASFEADAAAVMRLSPNQKPEYVVGGRQSIRFKFGREARVSQQGSAGNLAAARFGRTRFPSLTASAVAPMILGSSLALVPAQGQGKNLKSQIARGRDLFFNGTFGGNLRTCGTCHPANNNLTIDTAFIATLPANDPLFVAAPLDPDLPTFDPMNPLVPALEDEGLITQRGLILENIDGFSTTGGLLDNPPFFRAVPSLFNLEFTAPFGLSGDLPDLQTFATGAVVQHFTQSMSRTPGVDFVLPTAAQLADMEAFLLSNRSPASGNFNIAGRKSLLSTKADPKAEDTTRPEVRGRILFATVGCTSCHAGTVLSGGNRNTRVEALEKTPLFIQPPTPTLDTGNGFGEFQTPQLFGLRKEQFFHTGLLGNNGVQAANLIDAVSFYVSPQFKASPTGGQVGELSATDIGDIAKFLEAISVP